LGDTHFTVSVFILLLLVASAVGMATKWVRVPYTLALVIVGLVISPMHFLPTVHISPELILLIFLPALLFEGAWNLRFEQLRADLLPILALAVAGVCVSVGIVGLILHLGIGLAWSSVLLFGAMISATDPVSVLALFKHFGLPRRLTTIVEGESLFNDGTAVVVFRIILGIALGTAANPAQSLVWGSLREFGIVVFGGLATGAIVGLLGSTLTSYFDDHLLEITLTTIAAYGSFLLAETLHVSPVIAVLVAGLVIGNYGRKKGMSPSTQVAVSSFWEYAAFVVNSLVFLLIGLEIQVPVLLRSATWVGWAVLAMLVARVATVYGLLPLTNRVATPVPDRWKHVLVWGGLRGSLSIALVLSLPKVTPNRPELVAMVFGTVTFSLLVQGLSLSPLLRWLDFARVSLDVREYELVRGQLLTISAAMAELETLRAQGMVPESSYEVLRANFTESQESLDRKLAQIQMAHPVLDETYTEHIRKHLVDVRRTRLSQLLRDGILSKSTHDLLNAKLDEEAIRHKKEPGDAGSH
jgi:CPA1 family monovalent cation:H+ antiporter